MNRKQIKGFILLGVLLSIGLQSCRVALKEYKAPEIASTDLFRAEDRTDTVSIANTPWEQYFQDPALRALLADGLANNFDLQIAVERIKQAEAGLSIARGAFFPNVALVGQIQHNRSASNNSPQILGIHNEQYALAVAASWEAEIWGKMTSQTRARRAQFLASHTYRYLVQTSLIANIATSYYSLLALDEQLVVTKETVELLKKSTESMEELKQAGNLNGAAVEQNKALLYATEVSIPDLEINIRLLENSISLMLGRNSGPITRSTIHDQTVPAELDYGIPAQMLAKRPDVLQAELGFRSAFELTNVARASFYPSITLSTGSMIGYGSATLSNFFRPENIFASVLGGLTQPLFAQKQLIGQLKITKAQQEEALLNFEKTVITASKEVSDILFTYEASLSKNDIRAKQIKSLVTSVYFTQELLKAGEANYLEVLTAEQNLLQARLGQVSDKLEQLQASVNLYRALGGGVE